MEPSTTATGVRPWLVGLVRGLIHAVAAAAIVFAITILGGPDLPDGLQVWAPALVLALRVIEGRLDDYHDPTPQASALKGGRL
jgi:hypothetical protein